MPQHRILLTRFPFDEARHFIREHPLVADKTMAPLRGLAHGPYLLKGRDEPMDIFEVGAEGLAPLTAPPDGDKAKRAIRPGEEETLGWRPAVGLEIPGRTGWHLIERLGAGGFGEVLPNEWCVFGDVVRRKRERRTSNRFDKLKTLSLPKGIERRTSKPEAARDACSELGRSMFGVRCSTSGASAMPPTRRRFAKGIRGAKFRCGFWDDGKVSRCAWRALQDSSGVRPATRCIHHRACDAGA